LDITLATSPAIQTLEFSKVELIMLKNIINSHGNPNNKLIKETLEKIEAKLKAA
jgi:hypothetical protein